MVSAPVPVPCPGDCGRHIPPATAVCPSCALQLPEGLLVQMRQLGTALPRARAVLVGQAMAWLRIHKPARDGRGPSAQRTPAAGRDGT